MTFYQVQDLPQVGPEQVLLEEVRRAYTIVKWLELMISAWQTSPEDPDAEWQRLQVESEDGGAEDAPLTAMAVSKSTGLPMLGTIVRWDKGGTVAPTEYAAWLDRYERERLLAIRAAKMAIDAGVQERLVRLAEREVDTIVAVFRASFAEMNLELTPDRVAVIGRQLRAIGGTVGQAQTAG